MANTSTCANGHFYPATLTSCPFCAGGSTSGVQGPDVASADETRPLSSGTQPVQGDETLRDGQTRRVEEVAAPSDGGGATILHRPGEGKAGAVAQRRRLEGWLVSFTMDAAGIDFKLYEGKNSIGREADCSIRLAHDGKISQRHALIVFRDASWIFVDELASNASLINGQSVGLGERVALTDGDRITMGEHEFVFRTVKP
jgi:hypothetical protein